MRKLIIILFLLVILIFLALADVLWMPNVSFQKGKSQVVIIPSGTDFRGVMDILARDSILRHPGTFKLLARQKHYQKAIRPGRYIVRGGMNNSKLINMLRAGLQQPVNVIIHNIRTKEQLAGVVSHQLEVDSAGLVHLLSNPSFVAGYGMDTATVIALFIPDTYQFYWNTPAERFVKRMYSEYKKFWSRGRLEAAQRLGLTPMKVMTLASIVEEESSHTDEMPEIAGVYLNRLNKGIRLQADPTIKFVLHDFDRQRIITKDLKIDSPYNTYRHAGLPPGPIRIPSKTSIEAVLHAERHPYIYFCAKADFSGYHHFSRTLAEHNRYARTYRRALNKKRIYR